MSINTLQPLDDELFACYENNKHLLGGSLESFSESMLSVGLELMPRWVGNFLSTVPDAVKRLTANGKKLRRQADDREDYRMPAREVPLFVATMKRLDSAAGWAAAKAVCASVGSRCVPIPEPGAKADLARLGQLVIRFGDVINSTAHIVADGIVDRKDKPLMPAAIEDVRELIAAALAFEAQLVAVADAPEPAPAKGLRAVGGAT